MLQAYVTSGYVLWEHSQAGHTHVHPDVGLGGARSRLLPQEEQVAGEELQLWLACLGVLDDLWESVVEQSRMIGNAP